MSVIPAVVAVAGLIGDLLQKRKVELARQVGVSEETVTELGKSIGDYLSRDERALAAVMAEIDKARGHDTAMNAVNMPPLVDLLRGLVRPVITFAAFGWYVGARILDVPLGAEDYAMVGGILAFWFGFRPFEKKGGL
ncbi:MAG: DUF3243 family protein [Proteobacteria bacterium]|nr:DUF3243 family protein [Pseudomonadota bacterium]NBX86884.1 DUF3243 family protein [Pseudomonadota bacterium]